MANVALSRRDSYLAHVKSGLKQATLAVLHRSSSRLAYTVSGLLVLKRAEDNLGRFEDKGWSHGQFGGRMDNTFNTYKRSDRQTQEQRSGKQVFLTSGQGSTDI